jgi:hypothetical protein
LLDRLLLLLLLLLLASVPVLAAEPAFRLLFLEGMLLCVLFVATLWVRDKRQRVIFSLRAGLTLEARGVSIAAGREELCCNGLLIACRSALLILC